MGPASPPLLPAPVLLLHVCYYSEWNRPETGIQKKGVEHHEEIIKPDPSICLFSSLGFVRMKAAANSNPSLLMQGDDSIVTDLILT